FFSSRRRHTRFSRDWSSDVCSSDLPIRLLGCHRYSYTNKFIPIERIIAIPTKQNVIKICKILSFLQSILQQKQMIEYKIAIIRIFIINQYSLVYKEKNNSLNPLNLSFRSCVKLKSLKINAALCSSTICNPSCFILYRCHQNPKTKPKKPIRPLIIVFLYSLSQMCFILKKHKIIE